MNFSDQTIVRPQLAAGDMIDTLQSWVWPAEDRGAWDGPKLDWVNEHSKKWFTNLRDKKIAVQAGGCCGMYPRLLSDIFELVYTFEPDPLNFYCLTQNCQAENVIKLQAAIGSIVGQVDMLAANKSNVGTHRLKLANEKDFQPRFPIMTIDSLKLNQCDLIALDIEGYEYDALRGAAATILNYRPTVILERGKTSEIVETMASIGYHLKEPSSMDTIWVPD